MRLCENEHPEVYQVVGDDVPKMLARAAAALSEIEDLGWVNLSLDYVSGADFVEEGQDYILTIYLHNG